MAGKDTPPPVPLNISAEAHSVDALINTVIIFGGPGSWKRDAYWDEYMMSITNNGERPVILTSATLIDFQGNPVVSWDNPWELQEQSKAWIKNYDSGKTGVVLKVGAASVMTGAVVGGLVLVSGGAASAFGPSAAALASTAAPVAALVALPISPSNRVKKLKEACFSVSPQAHSACCCCLLVLIRDLKFPSISSLFQTST